MRKHSGQGLERHPDDVIVRLLRRKSNPGGLGMGPQEQRPCVVGVVALGDFACPYPACGTELGNFLKEIIMDVKKEGQPWRKGIDRETYFHGLLDVGQPIIQRKRQFLDRRGTGFADMIATNTDGIPSSRRCLGPANICTVDWSRGPSQSRRKSGSSTGVPDTSSTGHHGYRAPHREIPDARDTARLASTSRVRCCLVQ